MNQYAKLEDELNAADGLVDKRHRGSVFASIFTGMSAYISADFFEDGVYKAGAVFAAASVIYAGVAVGNWIRGNDAIANVTRIQREIEYLNQEGLEKKLE